MLCDATTSTNSEADSYSAEQGTSSFYVPPNVHHIVQQNVTNGL